MIGGGIAGLTAALALKRAGQTVAVLEAARVGTGVTGNTTGKVTSLHRLAYSELAARHGAGHRRHLRAGQRGRNSNTLLRVVAEEGIDCGFRRVANYTYAESERRACAGPGGSGAGRHGWGCRRPSPPMCRCLSRSRGAVRFDGQAQIHALRYVQGLARAVDGDGSFVFEESPATGFRDGSPGRGGYGAGLSPGHGNHCGDEHAVR